MHQWLREGKGLEVKDQRRILTRHKGSQTYLIIQYSEYILCGVLVLFELIHIKYYIVFIHRLAIPLQMLLIYFVFFAV